MTTRFFNVAKTWYFWLGQLKSTNRIISLGADLGTVDLAILLNPDKKHVLPPRSDTHRLFLSTSYQALALSHLAVMRLAAWEVAVLLHSELELAQLASDNLMAVSELPFDGIPSGCNHHGSSGSPEGRNCGTGILHYGNMNAGIHEVVSLSHSHTHSSCQ